MTQLPFLRDPTLALDNSPGDNSPGAAVNRPSVGATSARPSIELHLDPNYRSGGGGGIHGKIPPQLVEAAQAKRVQAQPFAANQFSAIDEGRTMRPANWDGGMRHAGHGETGQSGQSGRPLRYVLLIILILLGLGYGGYQLLAGDGGAVDPSALPLIAADTSPVRVKPSDPGGMEVPNQDALIYQELLGRKPEAEATVASPVEAPVKVAEQMQQPAPAPAGNGGESSNAGATATSVNSGANAAVGANGGAAATTTAPSAATAPTALAPSTRSGAVANPVPPTINPVGQSSSPASSTAQAVATTATTASASGAPAAAKTTNQNGTAAPQKPQDKPQEKTQDQGKAKPAPTASNAKDSAGKTGATFGLPDSKGVVRQPLRLQLAAVRSQEDAQAEWQRLQGKFVSLREYALDVRPLDKPAGVYRYRVLAGPMPDRATANQVCQSLKTSKQACSIVDLSGVKE